MPRKKIDEEAQRRSLVDEYAQLEAQLLPHRPRQRRLEELARLIRTWHAQEDPEATLTCEGEKYQVVLGPVGMQSHILSMTEVYRLLGRTQFLKIADVSLKMLNAHMHPSTVATLVERRRTGPRTLIARPK